jgi:hypothetical protein
VVIDSITWKGHTMSIRISSAEPSIRFVAPVNTAATRAAACRFLERTMAPRTQRVKMVIRDFGPAGMNIVRRVSVNNAVRMLGGQFNGCA